MLTHGLTMTQDGMMTGEPGHQRAAQERLSGPGFAHRQHEAFTLPNCRGDLLERPDYSSLR